MFKVQMTKHATQERMDRLVKIALTLGWGEILLKSPKENGTKMECITSTGVLMIMNKDCDTLITAFVPSIDKVTAVYKNCGQTVPKTLKQVVVRNTKKGYLNLG
jgi:hypothetical protein